MMDGTSPSSSSAGQPMLPFAVQAVDDPGLVVRMIEDDLTAKIGDVFVGLGAISRMPIDHPLIDARARTTLRRMKCRTWGDFAERTVGEIWQTPNAGRLTVNRLLTAAAECSRETLTSGRVSGPAPTEPALSEETPSRSFSATRLLQAVDELARWAVRERGATRLGDLLVVSPRLENVPSEIRNAVTRLSVLELTSLVGNSGAALSSSLLSDLLESAGRAREVLLARRIRPERRPTLEEVGKQMGLTKERVRQLETKADAAVQSALRVTEIRPLHWRATDLADSL